MLLRTSMRKGGSKMNQNIIKAIEAEQLKQDIVKFNVGDTVKVHLRVVEGLSLIHI